MRRISYLKLIARRPVPGAVLLHPPPPLLQRWEIAQSLAAPAAASPARRRPSPPAQAPAASVRAPEVVPGAPAPAESPPRETVASAIQAPPVVAPPREGGRLTDLPLGSASVAPWSRVDTPVEVKGASYPDAEGGPSAARRSVEGTDGLRPPPPPPRRGEPESRWGSPAATPALAHAPEPKARAAADAFSGMPAGRGASDRRASPERMGAVGRIQEAPLSPLRPGAGTPPAGPEPAVGREPERSAVRAWAAREAAVPPARRDEETGARNQREWAVEGGLPPGVAAPPARVEGAKPASIHIGSIEIQVAPPPAPVASPAPRRRTSEHKPALSRGFASVFGLRQG
jgi:hypothetical protein